MCERERERGERERETLLKTILHQARPSDMKILFFFQNLILDYVVYYLKNHINVLLSGLRSEDKHAHSSSKVDVGDVFKLREEGGGGETEVLLTITTWGGFWEVERGPGMGRTCTCPEAMGRTQ